MVQVTEHKANGTSLTVRSRWPSRELHPPVALLPGTGATATDWDEVAADLSRDRAVHAVDLRGHGQSDWPGIYSIDLMAEDLASLLPGLNEQLDLIGHSLGGLVACRAISSGAPEPHRLVLEDTGLLHARTAVTPLRPEGNLEFDWAVIEQVRPEIDDPAPHWPETLARIAVPTLAVGGGPNSFLPQEHVVELVALVQRASHITIDARTLHSRRKTSGVPGRRARVPRRLSTPSSADCANSALARD